MHASPSGRGGARWATSRGRAGASKHHNLGPGSRNHRYTTRAVSPCGEERELPVSSFRRAALRKGVDDELSNRWIDLDPSGYFLIRIDDARGVICAEHFLNTINADGQACDPLTGEVIPCDGSYKPRVHKSFSARTAKELSVAILEKEAEERGTVTLLVHANYLGREFQRAEDCLARGSRYIQD